MSAARLREVYGLDGRTALVTGGGSGIGLAVARCLAEAGARVIVAGRRVEALRDAAGLLGRGAGHRVLDLSATGGIGDWARALEADFGPIDILVNNAGNTVKKPFLESDLAEFDSVFDVHVRGALELTRALLPGQIDRGRGSVLFLSSMTAFIGQPNVLGYTVSKTAIGGVVRGLSAECAARGVRVNAVAPGWIDTDLYRKATAGDPERRAKILGRIASGALGTPEDIGWACAFLSSPAANYITGQVLLVDGGAATGF